jgi:uncharacterized membrane-anchored protein
MRRVILTLLAAAIVVAAAWVIFQLPGTVSAEIGPYSFAAASPVAALAVSVLLVVVYVLLRLIGFVVYLPRRLRLRRANRNRRFGDIAVTRALVALAAGDTGDARREAGRARRLLGDTAQTLLLAAEAGRLAGREDEAEAAFRQLSERPDAAFLGLRGLLRQAMERENWAEASALARQAEAAHPAAIWLRKERSALAVRTENWVEALHLADADAPKAALAAAAAGQATNPVQGIRLARQAWKEDRTLPAAALAYAAKLRADGRESRAQSAGKLAIGAAPGDRSLLHGQAARRAIPLRRRQETDEEQSPGHRVPHGPGADRARGQPVRRRPLPRRGGACRRPQSAPAMGAVGRHRGSRGRRYRGRTPCAAGRAAPCDDRRHRPDMALHRMRNAKCRLAARLPGLRQDRHAALAARPDEHAG